MQSLYKSEKGKKEILALYEKKLVELNLSSDSLNVSTTYGNTHVIRVGENSKPPLLLIHGSNGCAPIALETYPHLTEKYQVFAIDVLAQPNKSEETRLSMKDNSYGDWVFQILDVLQLENVTMVGFSFGGLIILKTLLFNESKIKEVFLSAPAFLVNGNPIKALFKVFIPMKRFMKGQNPKFLKKFLAELFTDEDEFALKYLAKVFVHFNMDFTPVPIIKNKEAQSITTPITLIAAKNDLMFPGEKMVKRAKKIFPSLKNSVLLPNSKHVQGKRDNELIEGLILN
ncbi:MAG: alpha/beta fold hydrolase [Salibacteraceae bacterium]